MVARRSPYQFFPPLPPAERAALKADIGVRGVLSAVEVDEAGDVIDGNTRVELARELGVDYPVLVREGWTKRQKIEQAIKGNSLRRHLGPMGRARALEALAQSEGATLGTKGGPAGNRATVERLAAEL